MNNFNFSVLEGCLTKDPTLQRFADDNHQCSFTIGCNRSYTNKAGKRVEDTGFFEITAWGKLAETCGKYLKKGKRVLVSGMLKDNKFKTHTGGNKNRPYIEAREVNFLNTATGA